jgi:hypothetical protein
MPVVRLGAGLTWLYTQLRQMGRVGAATSARLFFTDLEKRLQPPSKATGNLGVYRTGPAPVRALLTARRR